MRQRKRRRQDSDTPLPLEERLESLIVRIGEKNSQPLEKNLEDLAHLLNEDSVRYKANIIRIICEWLVSFLLNFYILSFKQIKFYFHFSN